MVSIILYHSSLQRRTVHRFLLFALFFLGCGLNIIQKLPKFSVHILAIVIEGTLSQMFHLGPSSRFIFFRKSCSQLFLNVSRILA